VWPSVVTLIGTAVLAFGWLEESMCRIYFRPLLTAGLTPEDVGRAADFGELIANRFMTLASILYALLLFACRQGWIQRGR